MNRWDEIPQANPDFSASMDEIAICYQQAYFSVSRFASREVLRSEQWRLSAIYGWTTCIFMAAFIIFGVVK